MIIVWRVAGQAVRVASLAHAVCFFSVHDAIPGVTLRLASANRWDVVVIRLKRVQRVAAVVAASGQRRGTIMTALVANTAVRVSLRQG